ncbi:hypothetical protein EV643_12281 [Kribbella sp. VKM Ac-2527]|uniref:Uncharacterized protein n=1 Tax=Kribbella caucasensis TaxID=2512215 RepID=A0A4R6JHT9_9ACTN|nr:hypothetical protein [Kribbella sp. VKM Ac-2527]TDO35670.1 hypothetical protein EV643_12281 [Kribbella sp. VKM Ac-2527]
MTEPGIEVPLDAPEADVLAQSQSPAALDDEDDDLDSDVPQEANPADVVDQRRSVRLDDEDDYQ